MEPQPAPASYQGRLVAGIVLAAIAATLVVAWLLGAFRPSAPASTTDVTSAPSGISAVSPAVATPAASPSGATTPSSIPVASPSPSASSGPSTEPSPSTPDPVLVGVGDIATCDHNDDEQTAALVARLEGIVFTLGDNAYDRGSTAEFNDCYDPSWGRVKDRTEFPVAGNHDWDTRNAAGYREYFGKVATPNGQTWYSRDVGAWHVIVLDANCTALAGGCRPGSPQLRWLRQDLAASDATCTLAMWHQPRFSSGEHGNDKSVAPFWDALYAGGADLIVNGHDHDFERFAPQDPDGNRDDARGIVEIVAGTGGGEMRSMAHTVANSIVRKGRLLGVLQVTLHPDGWDSRFIPTDGYSFTDESHGTCH